MKSVRWYSILAMILVGSSLSALNLKFINQTSKTIQVVPSFIGEGRRNGYLPVSIPPAPEAGRESSRILPNQDPEQVKNYTISYVTGLEAYLPPLIIDQDTIRDYGHRAANRGADTVSITLEAGYLGVTAGQVRYAARGAAEAAAIEEEGFVLTGITPYRVLGIDESASKAEQYAAIFGLTVDQLKDPAMIQQNRATVQKNYRNLALRWHPDKRDNEPAKSTYDKLGIFGDQRKELAHAVFTLIGRAHADIMKYLEILEQGRAR